MKDSPISLIQRAVLLAVRRHPNAKPSAERSEILDTPSGPYIIVRDVVGRVLGAFCLNRRQHLTERKNVPASAL